MKKIAKIYIFITAFSFTLSSNSFAQNQKNQNAEDYIESASQNEKIADKIINNDDEKNTKINGKFYFGIDALIQNSSLSGNAKDPNEYYETQTSAISIFTGYDNLDFFKIEGFYSKSNEKKEINDVSNFSSFELKTKTLGLDFKPYLNFDKESQALFYLIFGLNYSQIDIAEINQTKTYAINKINTNNRGVNKIVPAFGLGVEYLFYRNFALRFQYKRNFVDAKIRNLEVLSKVKVIDNLSVGVSHSF
jgi:hypothetical protein